MRLRRAQIIWICSEGRGKIFSFSISPFLLILLLLLISLCIGAVPFLERGILSLKSRATDLENEREALKGDLTALLYLKETVAHIQENEKILRNHFGLDKYRTLEKTSGVGGESIPFRQWAGARVQGAAGSDPGGRGMRENLEGKMKALASDHETLSRLKIRQGELWEGTPSIIPVELEHPKISSPFGFRKNPFTNKSEFHAGVDFIGITGTKIMAPASGKVLNTGHDQWLGNYVVLNHPAGFKTIYGHLHEIRVRDGAEIKRGDLIGAMGNTGLSTGPHLHYGIIKGDRAVDPMQFMLDRKG